MSKKKVQSARFTSETVHTVQLPELFSLLRYSVAGDWMRSVSRHSDGFNGDMSFAEARDAAEFGKWTPPQIKTLVIPELTAASDDMRYYYDVCGEVLDVASFCSGEPEYWQVAEPIQKPCGRIIRFAVEIGGLGDIESEHLRARGEAIIALINSLELQGHSVEVTIVRAFINSDKQSYKFLIPVKQAGQPCDVRRLQFMIGHPAFYRRCLFGLTELAQGKPMGGTRGTFTQEFAPAGFIHIGHKKGLGPDQIAMQWAKEFAHSIAADNTRN